MLCGNSRDGLVQIYHSTNLFCGERDDWPRVGLKDYQNKDITTDCKVIERYKQLCEIDKQQGEQYLCDIRKKTEKAKTEWATNQKRRKAEKRAYPRIEGFLRARVDPSSTVAPKDFLLRLAKHQPTFKETYGLSDSSILRVVRQIQKQTGVNYLKG